MFGFEFYPLISRNELNFDLLTNENWVIESFQIFI